VAALAAAACPALVASFAAASNSSTYADATADAAAAPDLGAVEVSNDDAGNVVIRITVQNREALEDRDFVTALLDTDRSTRTGCARGTFGAEYALDVLARKFLFGRCTGGRWSFKARPPGFGGSFADSTLTLRVNRRDLGGATAFRFRIGAAAASADEAAYDFAPDAGASAWSYTVVAPPQTVKKPPRRRGRHARSRRH
jgi:hypothetical protein